MMIYWIMILILLGGYWSWKAVSYRDLSDRFSLFNLFGN